MPGSSAHCDRAGSGAGAISRPISSSIILMFIDSSIISLFMSIRSSGIVVARATKSGARSLLSSSC